MKNTQIVDKRIRKKRITLPSVIRFAEYLIRTGWTKIEQDNPNILVFGTRESGCSGSESPILVFPSEDFYSDAKSRISDALHVVATFRKKSFSDIVREVFYYDFDVLRQRIDIAGIRGIPLELMPKLVKGYKDLINQSAQLESCQHGERPYCLGKSTKTIQAGNEIVKKCLFGHTFAGSFGISIEMPLKIDPNQFADVSYYTETIERLTMQRIAVGLDDATNTWQKDHVSFITDNFENGFNIDLCQTMGSLMSTLAQIEESPRVEYIFGWSPLIVSDKQRVPTEPITFTPADIVPVFQRAANEMRALQGDKQVTVEGEILTLTDDPEIKETNERKRRAITIRCKNKPEISEVKITLSTEEDYATACRARADRHRISARGVLIPDGKAHHLRCPQNFKVVEVSRSLFEKEE